MTTRSWRHYITRPLSLGLVVGLCSLATAGTSAAATWTPIQIDNAADVGRFASMAADANRKLHVSYLDASGNLKYASDKSGSWLAETVTNPNITAGKVVLAGTALALDAGNNPHVNYHYNDTVNARGFRNIVYNGSAWANPSTNITQNFAPALDQASSIFHRGGFSHIAFVKYNGSNSSFQYVKNTTAGNYANWGTVVQIDAVENSGASNSIVVDSQGKVFIVGYNSTSTDLFYYTNESGSFVKTTLVSSTDAVGKYCNLALDASDNLHLTYLETTASPASYRIKYQFKPAGGAWQSAVDLADAGQFGGFPSIKTDANGSVHISYYYSASSGSGSLRYATNYSGSWSNEEVDASSSDVGKYSSIAVDSNRTVSIAYYDATNSALRLSSTQITAVPVISLNPVSLAFGSVNRWASSSLPITISNSGQATLSISSISLSGASASQFSKDSCSSVPSGGNCTVTVTLTPDSGGLKSASLSIASNDPVTPTAQVPLSGSSPWWISAQVGHGGSGGSITPSGQQYVDPGQSLTFDITSAGAPFSLSDVLVDDVSVGAVGSYTFSNVASDHSIESLFVSPIRLVGIPFIYYATVQGAYDAIVESGTMQTLTAIPAPEALLIDQPVTATIKGGYDPGFSSQSASTPLSSITISNGNLTPDGLVLQ